MSNKLVIALPNRVLPIFEKKSSASARSSLTAAGYAQSAIAMQVPSRAIRQLEDLKEWTKLEAVAETDQKAGAETRPELNRFLVISTDDFLRVATNGPTKEAYLKCLDTGLARINPLTNTSLDRQHLAQYFREIMEIVGLESSEGRLSTFVASSKAATSTQRFLLLRNRKFYAAV